MKSPIYLVMLFCSGMCFAQTASLTFEDEIPKDETETTYVEEAKKSTAKNENSLESINSLFKTKDYQKAATAYDSLLYNKNTVLNIKVLQQAGDAHYNIGNMEKAAYYYKRIFEVQHLLNAYLTKKEFIEDLKKDGRIEFAKRVTQAFEN